MSEYGGKLAEGIYKMDFETTRLAQAEALPLASPCPLDETSMPTFPGIESWLHLVDSSEGLKLPLDISTEASYVEMGASEDDDETLEPPSPSLSPNISVVAESKSSQLYLQLNPGFGF